MKAKFTHTGTIEPCSAATLGNAYPTTLRETTRWWVTVTGAKYNKRDGWRVGEQWPHWKLNIESIKPI